jgi:hypothetical protein
MALKNMNGVISIQILAMISKLCGDQSGMCPTQTLRAGFCKASASDGETPRPRPVNGLQAVQPECGPDYVAAGTSCVCSRFLTFQSQPFLLSCFQSHI